MADNWWSLEVLDASTDKTSRLSAARWRDTHSAALIEAAISHGAKDWYWHQMSWGIVLEIAFEQWDAWSVYRNLPAVLAALDAAPDPINGVYSYPGRGGSSGARMPRRPIQPRGAGSAPLPPLPDLAFEDFTGTAREVAAA
jgi:hypothetical protein